jgi:hypothetical protein
MIYHPFYSPLLLIGVVSDEFFENLSYHERHLIIFVTI